jgi:glycosyltransferase involved in cell wall biosynthesis
VITVVVPTRGEPRYLAEALASIRADSSAEAEIVVVEDGTDHVDAALAGDARVIRLPYVGRSVARNAGVNAARTELVAFLDADDVSLPGRLAAQQEALESSPDAALAFGRADIVDGELHAIDGLTDEEQRRYGRLLARGTTYESLVVDCPIYTSATMVRRDAFLAAGGYDRLLDAYEDFDLYLRLARSAYLVPSGDGALALHRIHGANTPSPDYSAGSYHVARKHLAEAGPACAGLLRERQVYALWNLGDFPRARAAARRAAAGHPSLLAHPQFAKRLVTTSLPLPLLRALRARREP